jgi:hypothetical protein
MLKLIIAAACLCASVVQARSSDLSGQEISDLLAGATIELDTPTGTKLPVRYARDGKVSGEAGDLAWYLGAATDRGRWWVAGDELCHKWNRWFSSEPQCLRLRKEGRLIRWRKPDGNTGTAMITVPAPSQMAVASAAPLFGFRKAAPAPPPEALAAIPKAIEPERALKPPPGALAADAGKPRFAFKEALAPPPPVAAAPSAGEKEPSLPSPAQPNIAVPKDEPPPPKLAAPKRAAEPMFKVANVRSDDVLNVRSGPSADFGIVSALPPGSRGIAITGPCRSQWCPVRHQASSGWVNSIYLVVEEASPAAASTALRDSPEALRSCLTPAVHALLDRIEQQFGSVQVISTCRAGATIPGTWRPSRHASGNAVDFKAGARKDEIIAWLVANHRRGGTMTYPGIDHIHVDIGPHFVSIAGGPRWASWREGRSEAGGAR